MSGFSQNSNFVYSVDELGLTKVWEVSGKEKLPTSSMVEGRLPVSTKELKIVSSRNSSGKKLWHSEEFIEPRLTKAAWLTVAPTMLSFWLPAELRGDQQVVKDNTLLTFGEMLAGVIKLEIS
ncbi:hypothetical protein DFJ73DRAFT_758506 [Zopfochytrium polystomum]|nr:hypothetical protein DFJ73DRAFT_758506 [Zopfochytrium polystomum]